MKTPARASGFTLIEILITVAIVAILSAIALPSYTGYIEKSKYRTAQSDVMALAAAIENIRQRTLSYAVVEGADTSTAAEIQNVVTTWSPASTAYEFAIGGKSATAYIITATAIAPAGNLANCSLRLSNDGSPSVGAGACKYTVGTQWH